MLVSRFSPLSGLPEKQCSKCKAFHPLVDFNKNRNCPDGLRSACRACEKLYKHRNADRISVKASEYRQKNKTKLLEWTLEHLYKITAEQYRAMYENQNGVCAICKQPELERNQYALKKLAVDHDHVTGKIRGLLCARCNVKLGVLENASFVVAAQEYLSEFNNIL